MKFFILWSKDHNNNDAYYKHANQSAGSGRALTSIPHLRSAPHSFVFSFHLGSLSCPFTASHAYNTVIWLSTKEIGFIILMVYKFNRKLGNGEEEVSMFYHACSWWALMWALSLRELPWKPPCHSGWVVLGVDTREIWLHGWEGRIPCWRPQSCKVLNAGSMAISCISWVGWRGRCFVFNFSFIWQKSLLT